MWPNTPSLKSRRSFSYPAVSHPSTTWCQCSLYLARNNCRQKLKVSGYEKYLSQQWFLNKNGTASADKSWGSLNLYLWLEQLSDLVTAGDDLTSLAVVMTGRSSKLVRDKVRFETSRVREDSNLLLLSSPSSSWNTGKSDMWHSKWGLCFSQGHFL